MFFYKNMTHHLNKEEPFMTFIMVFKGKENPTNFFFCNENNKMIQKVVNFHLSYITRFEKKLKKRKFMNLWIILLHPLIMFWVCHFVKFGYYQNMKGVLKNNNYIFLATHLLLWPVIWFLQQVWKPWLYIRSWFFWMCEGGRPWLWIPKNHPHNCVGVGVCSWFLITVHC